MPKLRLFITVLCVFSISHGVWGQTVTMNATDDTWTHGLSSTSTEGSSSRLSICPAAGYWIYLKFDVSEIEEAVLDAELRMTRFDGSRPEEISLYFIPDDDWQESSLTGQNRPSPQNPSPHDALITGNDHGSYDSWHSTALADAVEREKNGDGIISLMVREDPHNQLDVRSYFSREGASSADQRPQLVLTLAQEMTGNETLADGWKTVEIGSGVKPSFDFGPNGKIHIMGMTESQQGVVWHAAADTIDGPWNPATVAEGYFYGPGDIRVGNDGTAHIAWHDHNAQNPSHVAIQPSGTVTRRIINTPSSHDGWDNSLAFGPEGNLHQASVFPVTFGAQECLQYGVFDGNSWNYERNLNGSGSFMYGFNTSIAIDRQGNPHIVYCQARDWTDPGDLKYAFMTDSGWQFSTVASGGIRGRFPTLALDHWDRPHVAWLDIDSDNHSLGIVQYGVLNSDQWEIEEVDRLENVQLGFSNARKSTSLVLDSEFRPHIAYADKQTIKLASKPFAEWEYTTVLQNDEDLYKGLVVLRLDGNDHPGLVFWQRSNQGPGLIRFAQPEITPIHSWWIY